MTIPYNTHTKALGYLRRQFLDRKLSYREMAEMLMAYSAQPMTKSHVWNAMYKTTKCPANIRIGLENMGLLRRRPRRYRFFYEVSEEEYDNIASFLSYHSMSFSQYMADENAPWKDDWERWALT